MSDAVKAVVSALTVLYSNPDREAKEKANTWLGEFQKSNEAWATSQLILFAPDAPVEPKLFAAQTFRTKITYDLHQLPGEQLLPLRDSLLAALRQFASGPRVILTQVCIALADLALQLTPQQCSDPVTVMIDQFGKEPEMAAALLDYLQVLAEEYNSNFKIQVRQEFGREGEKTAQRGEQVISLLSMYVQASGITPQLQNQCYQTLGAWLRTGQIRSAALAGAPILAAAFSALASDELFDAAVDVLVDIIHETMELQENVAVIQEIVPRLTALAPHLADPDTRADEDKMRGYCRILVEAGEWYEPLIVQHPASFLPLVQLIQQCAAYSELEVVGITLNFWYRLAKGILKVGPSDAVAPLLQVFADLVGIVIGHLHYPDEMLKGEERDTFRDFRYKIGDTLKDCCEVLGSGPCLQQAYDIIARAVATGVAVKWQDVEAPLFSMRSMGSKIDVRDNDLVPRIMEMLPKLPPHPRIRYAAILVIGRYTHWTQQHPEHIQFQLPYVSAGFDESDPEVLAAASQTMKYLCKDCSEHLVPFLPQLHTFIQTVSDSGKLNGEDLLDLSAAIAHILQAMPPSEIAPALSTFVMPNIELVHATATQEAPASKEQLRKVTDALERTDVYLAIIGGLPEGALPASCAATCQQVWSVLDTLLARYGHLPAVANRTCIALRRGLVFFDELAFAVAPAMLERLASAFEAAPASDYLWITGKLVQQFSGRGDAAFSAGVKSAFERQSGKLFEVLQSTAPAQVPDILDDYVHLVQALADAMPDHIFLSPAFPSAFQSTLTALTLPSVRIVLAALDTIRAIIGHDALHDPSASDSYLSPAAAQHAAASFPAYAQAIRTVVDAHAPQLLPLLLDVLVGGGEDEPHNVLTILRLLSIHFPTLLAQAVPPAVDRLPARAAGSEEKQEFLHRFSSAITNHNANQVKDAFTWLLRTSRRSYDRARVLQDRA